MPSHYLNQCWNIVDWTLRNIFQSNFNRNWNIFIQENALENVVCKMSSILSQPQCVNTLMAEQNDPILFEYICLKLILWLDLFSLKFFPFDMQYNFTECIYFLLSVIVRRAGLLWSQQDFEWRWSVPLFKCLIVLEFSFILFDLCLLITFFNFIMNYVPIVTFWIFTYHKIWILSIMFCFIWSYWIIYFLACLEVSWRVVS